MPKSSCALASILFAAITPALAQKVPDLLLNGGGANAQISDHQIVASGSTVYAVWRDRRVSTSSPWFRGDIYFNRSHDGGATWLPGDVRLNLGSAPMSAVYAPRIAVAGASVCVVWRDMRNNPSSSDSSDLYCNCSLDGGTTWLPNALRLDTGRPAGSSGSVDPRITASGSSFYVFWVDYRRSAQGHVDVYCNRSTDQGRTWLPADVPVTTGATGNWFDSVDAKAWGSSVYVCWMDLSNGHEVNWFNRSLDGGLTWLPSPVRLDDGTPAMYRDHAQLAAWGPFVYAVWSDSRNGNNAFDVFYNRSTDQGATWQPADVRLDTGSAAGQTVSLRARIAAVDSQVYVTWMDGNVHWNCSADFGATWLPVDVRIDHGLPTSTGPELAVDGAAVHVAWTNVSDPLHANVYCNRSLDRGAHWLPVDVRLNIGTTAAAGSAWEAVIAASGSSVYCAWQDRRNQHDYDLYFNLAAGFQPYGTGTAGGNALVPLLSGSGTPAVGGTVVLQFDRGLGGTAGLLAVGFEPSARIALPLLGGSLLVLPAGTSFFALGGAAGVPGAGSRSLLVPVPNDLGLLGLNADWQGLFLDPAAPQGVSMSNALEAWFD